MMGFLIDQRYDMATGVLATTVPLAFIARLLSTKVALFARHPIITTSAVFASIVVAIGIYNQLVHVPGANYLGYNLISFVACFGIAAIAAIVDWIVESPWQNRRVQPAA
jgi:hypothetical protein